MINMKKKMLLKKLVAMGLAAALLAATFAGCGSNNDSSSGSNSSSGSSSGSQTNESDTQGDTGNTITEKEPITFNIAVNKHTHSMSQDFNDMLAFQWAEEATNVHINWIMVEAGATEKVNAMLTADLPDAFLNLLSESQVASSPDSFVDISGMLEEHAPHVLADYATFGGLDRVTRSDGSVRTLMTGPQVNFNNESPGNLFINTVWLEQIGKDMPTTMDELYEILCLFRDNDMNGNGDKTDEIPLKASEANWAAYAINLANSWGIAGYSSGRETHYFMVKNGVVTPTMDTQAYREFLEYMNKLVREGLYDKESFTEQNDEFFAKLKSGVVGVALCFSPYAMMTEELASQYEPIVSLKVDGYDYVKTGHKNQITASTTGFAITTACENPERLLEWWDYLSSDKTIKLTNAYGPEGGYWLIGEDGKTYQGTPDGLTDDFTIENYKYTYGMMGGSVLILKDEDQQISKEQSYSGWYKQNTTTLVWDLLQDEYPPDRLVPTDKLDERAFIETDLFDKIKNFMATSITEGITDASWEAYLNDLKTYQYYDWIQWYQDYVDGKF